MYVRIYVIECKSRNYYYVGTTVREMWVGGGQREKEHQEGWGSKFTTKHGFCRTMFVTLVSPGQASTLENDLTRWLMHKYGWKNASGGDYTNQRKDRLADRRWMPPEFREDPENPGPMPPPKFPTELNRLQTLFLAETDENAFKTKQP